MESFISLAIRSNLLRQGTRAERHDITIRPFTVKLGGNNKVTRGVRVNESDDRCSLLRTHYFSWKEWLLRFGKKHHMTALKKLSAIFGGSRIEVCPTFIGH